MILASKSTSSVVSDKGKKMSTTSFESSVTGGDHLGMPMEKKLSKDKSDAHGISETMYLLLWLSCLFLCLTCR